VGESGTMVETCINCGERAVVFVIANKWRCKKCGKYFDWTQIKGAKK
jgi:ribosomal protein L37AE/L43A